MAGFQKLPAVIRIHTLQREGEWQVVTGAVEQKTIALKLVGTLYGRSGAFQANAHDLERVAGFVGCKGAKAGVPDSPVFAGIEYVEKERRIGIGGDRASRYGKGLDLPGAAAIDLGHAGEVDHRDLEVDDAEGYCAGGKGYSEDHDGDGRDLGGAKSAAGNRRWRHDEALEQVEVNRTIVKDEEDIDS